MKLLLDTHIWLWSVLEPARLRPSVVHELTQSKDDLWLSPLSTWEALLLNSKRRLRIDEEVGQWLERARVGLHEAPLTHQIVFAAQQLPFPHRDPVDRFLAATALVLDLTLVTADERLLGLGEIRTLANR